MVNREKKDSENESHSLSLPEVETLYNGEFEQAFDSSNRIKLPRGWIIPGSPKDFFILPSFAVPKLVVFTVPKFDALLQKIVDQEADGEKQRQLQRELSAVAQRVERDDQGRITLPQSLLSKVGFTNRAALVGLFRTFEIWPAEKYSRQTVSPALSAELQKRL
jgi:division/cell wall cluster transcriptional repressor MraZ